MEPTRFEVLTGRLLSLLTRRALAGALSLGAIRLPGLATGKRKRHHKRKRKHKRKKKTRVTFNAFGCVDVGNFCQSDDQCCSGICTGAQGKTSCQAHDTGGCQPADDACLHEDAVDCPVDAGGASNVLPNAALPWCYQTTGKAGFCGIIQAAAPCGACTKDADCAAEFGAGAACVVCARHCPEFNQAICMRAAM